LCRTPLFSFPPNTTLPSNFPAIPVMPGDASGFVLVGTAGSIALDQLEDPVRPTGRWRLLVPSQAPSVGTWQIDYNLSCPQDSSIHSYALAIGPNAQLPTTIGAIAPIHQTECQTVFDTLRPNGATGFVDIVNFELTVSPELTPWLPITAFKIQHKTASFFEGDYGAHPAVAGSDVLWCSDLNSYVDSEVHVDGGEATRIVDVTAHIAGATSDPAELHEPYPPMCEVSEGGPDCVANPRDAGFDATQDTRFADASAASFNATQDTGVVDANPGTPSSDKSSDAPPSDANPSHPEPSLESHDVGSDGCAMGGPVGNHAAAWIMALALSMRRLRRCRRADPQRGAGASGR
jgi:hypothetical protein